MLHSAAHLYGLTLMMLQKLKAVKDLMLSLGAWNPWPWFWMSGMLAAHGVPGQFTKILWVSWRQSWL